MSWFTDLSSTVGDFTSKFQAAIPIDKATLQKLTLTTDELTAERQRIDEEERRKEQVKDSLAGMLLWETRDTEREILVEECKEAILELSANDATFLGPYRMPALPNINEENHDNDKNQDDDDEEKEPGPSPESLEKLAKLEPLPPLLDDFDLDAHVGLIERLLKVDEKLVEKQSRLSGAGDREKCFWRNYFFHCAFTRYEAGLSIDEIWSDQPSATSGKSDAAEELHQQQEETITFEQAPSETPEPPTANLDRPPLFDSNPSSIRASDEALIGGITSSGSNEGTEFELVGRTDEDDAELDELEAEIARELED